MALVDAYDTKTGKKLPYQVPEHHIDHPVLGRRLSKTPSQRAQEEPRPDAGRSGKPNKGAATDPRPVGETKE